MSDTTELNQMLTRMYHLREDYRRLDAESKALKDEYLALEDKVIGQLRDQNLSTAGNEKAKASLSHEEVPNIDPEHWEEVREWLFENGYADALPKSLKAASVRELWAMGIEIPHVSRFKRTKLSLTSR